MTFLPKPLLRHALALAVSAVLLYLLGRLVDWGAVGVALAGARALPLLGAVLVTFLFPILNTVRWLAVVRALGLPLGLGRAFSITMACWPVGTLTPGKAGELLKGAAVGNHRLGIGSVLAERVIDVAVLGSFGVIFGLVVGSVWAVLGGLVGVVGGLGLLAGGRIVAAVLGGHRPGPQLEAFAAVMPRFAARPHLLLGCVLASALNWFLSMLQLALLLSAFNNPMPLEWAMAILPAATFIGLLPVTVAGMGTRDAALLFLGRGIVDPAALLAAGIVYTFLGYFLLGALGLPFLGRDIARFMAGKKEPADSRPKATRKL